MTNALSFQNFADNCVIRPRIAQAEVDILGAKTGPSYRHNDQLHSYALRLMAWLPNIRGGEVAAIRGADAWRMIFVLLACPYVIDWRTQVPVYFTEASRRAGIPSLVLEFVLTVELKSRPGLPHLHVIHTKPMCERKLLRLHSLGVTTEMVTGFPRQMRLNSMWCYARLCGHQVENIDFSARCLADYLNRSTAHGTLRRRLWLARSRVSIRNFEEDKYRIFAAAVVLGYVFVDHNFKLDIDAELHLK